MTKKWNNFLRTIVHNIFKLNRRLLRKLSPENPLIDDNGTLYYDYGQSIQNHLYAQQPGANGHRLHNPPRKKTLPPPRKHIFLLQVKFGIYYIIRKLPNKKATGPDQTNNCMLKRSGKKTIIYLCHIFNNCARIEYFPDLWKEASIIMLQKPEKDTKYPSNHRPISLLNYMSKTFEKLISNRLNITTMSKIRLEKFGFCPQHSTTIHLTNLIDHITNKLNARKITTATLLDIKKPFDSVWHAGLIYKLILLEVLHQLINLIKSLFKNRTFHVK